MLPEANFNQGRSPYPSVGPFWVGLHKAHLEELALLPTKELMRGSTLYWFRPSCLISPFFIPPLCYLGSSPKPVIGIRNFGQGLFGKGKHKLRKWLVGKYFRRAEGGGGEGILSRPMKDDKAQKEESHSLWGAAHTTAVGGWGVVQLYCPKPAFL